jgi:hypothetical protein
MMTKICTDVEQSNKLIELGIDVNTADMCYHFIEINKTPLCIRWEKVHDDEKDNSIPAWSLSVLLGLMPTDDKKDEYYVTTESHSDYYTVNYRNCWDGCIHSEYSEESLLDAVFEIIVWLKENGKL